MTASCTAGLSRVTVLFVDSATHHKAKGVCNTEAHGEDRCMAELHIQKSSFPMSPKGERGRRVPVGPLLLFKDARCKWLSR